MITKQEDFIRKLIREELDKITNINDNFWKWFSGSKVVDKNNKPLVVYHGTKADFNAFDYDKLEGDLRNFGFYFTDDLSHANEYSTNGKTIKAYLSLKNPYYVEDNEQFVKDILKRIGQFMGAQKRRNELIKDGYDGIIYLKIKNFVAFYPEQIKSVDNDGSWDINDDNIYS